MNKSNENNIYAVAIHHDIVTPLENNMELFQDVVEKYNISMFFAQQIRQLKNYEICIICDDSGSMCNPSIYSNS